MYFHDADLRFPRLFVLQGVANLLVPWLLTTFMATLTDTSINLYILIDKRQVNILDTPQTCPSTSTFS